MKKLSENEKYILYTLLWQDCKWIARDKNGQLFAYKKEPWKDGNGWKDSVLAVYAMNLKLDFVKWEDKEPVRIDEIISEAEHGN